MMGGQVQARYLNVEWLDEKTVTSFSSSLDPLELYKEEGAWKIDAHVFNGHFSRIGFRILDQEVIHRPYFVVDQDPVEELLAVVDPSTGETWWIQNSGWDHDKRRYNSQLQRTVGTAKVCIQNLYITIQNHSSNFTVQELESYLSDFKADLWLIIFNPQGRVKGKIEKGVPSILGEDLFRLLLEFAGAAEKIAANLEVELKEVVGKKPLRSVRPIVQTFVEVASRGYARQLSSRAFVEVADTGDNRYVHHLLIRLLFMVDQLASLALTQKSHLNQMVKEHASWRDELLSKNDKVIDKEVFQSELIKLDDEVEAVRSSVNAPEMERHNDSRRNPKGDYTLLLGDLYGKSDDQFFCNELDGDNFKETYNGWYCVVTLPNDLATQVAKLSNGNRRPIKLKGMLSKSKHKNSKGGDFYRIEYSHVESVEFIGPTAADVMREKIPKLEAASWHVPLSSQERRELNQEAAALAARESLLNVRVSELDRMLKELDGVSRRFAGVVGVFRQRRVGRSARFPNSMTFVRNPGYFSVKSSYEKIRSLSGVEDDVLNSMAIIDDIGLVNVSNLYEKWCLLQIIKVLRDGFGFQLEGDWQRALVNSVLNQEHNICFEFKGAATGWTAKLGYEKVLANNRRPDFVFDLSVPCYEQTQLPNSKKWFHTGDRSVRIVMDAKFRERWQAGELAQLVTHLRDEKNYSEQAINPVFILHPCYELGQPRTSPLTWGKSCDYGQTARHESGAIYLSPRRTGGSSLDNLHRLFGMVLQEASHYLYDGEGRHWSDAQCISCGRAVDGREVQLKYTTTRTGKDRWELNCHHCKLVSIRTNCYGCGRALHKNGHYWTYHRTRAESQSNVVCPSCECFFDGVQI